MNILEDRLSCVMQPLNEIIGKLLASLVEIIIRHCTIYVNAMSLSYVKSMLWALENYGELIY